MSPEEGVWSAVASAGEGESETSGSPEDPLPSRGGWVEGVAWSAAESASATSGCWAPLSETGSANEVPVSDTSKNSMGGGRHFLGLGVGDGADGQQPGHQRQRASAAKKRPPSPSAHTRLLPLLWRGMSPASLDPYHIRKPKLLQEKPLCLRPKEVLGCRAFRQDESRIVRRKSSFAGCGEAQGYFPISPPFWK